ncbi:hypothetical protein MK280_15775, partial [Myxococcota bacterium]|nr:hypothetical protein [Myxococcota bacterium]
SLPRRADYGSGAYWRSIRLFADPARAWGELADDFHHFSISLHHDGGRILSVEGDGIRLPWTTCWSARAPLEDLVGAPLGVSLRETWSHSDPRRQCTHWFDLACLAWMQATRFCATGQATPSIKPISTRYRNCQRPYVILQVDRTHC